MARSGVLYGPTGAWKTTAVKHFAHYIAEATGKATALVSLDGGGWASCDPEVAVGMILPYRIDQNDNPLPALRAISQGRWPGKETTAQWQGRSVTAPNFVPMDWNEVGGIAVEGWTSIGQAVMRYLPDRNISVGGEDRNKLGGFAQPIVVDGQVVEHHFRSSTRGDYGFVQNFLYGLVMNFNSLPCRYVLFTALESKGEDDDRKTVYGPAIPGKAAIDKCPSWVGDCIHAADYPVQRQLQVPDPGDRSKTISQTVIDMVVRYYFVKHADPVTGIPFPAKPRVTPEKVRELVKAYPGGYFEPTPEKGLDEYLRLCDRLGEEQAQSDSLRAWRERRDGRTVGAKANAGSNNSSVKETK